MSVQRAVSGSNKGSYVSAHIHLIIHRAYSEIDMEFIQNFMITSDADPVYHSVSFKEYGMYTIEVNPFQKTVGG